MCAAVLSRRRRELSFVSGATILQTYTNWMGPLSLSLTVRPAYALPPVSRGRITNSVGASFGKDPMSAMAQEYSAAEACGYSYTYEAAVLVGDAELSRLLSSR